VCGTPAAGIVPVGATSKKIRRKRGFAALFSSQAHAAESATTIESTRRVAINVAIVFSG